MTELGGVTLSDRINAANLVRDDPWDRAIGRLLALGLPLPEIKVIISSAGPVAGATQQQTIETLYAMGFDSGQIHELTGIAKTTVQPAVSKLKKDAGDPADGTSKPTLRSRTSSRQS